MKTAIVTDSAAYLDKRIAKDNQIIVVPIPVIFGDEVYLEGQDISNEAFYHKLKNEATLPTTAQISLGQMQAVFDQLVAQGFDEVICIHLSAGISGFVDNLTAYAKEVTAIKVHAFDSQTTSAAEGYIALKAAKMVKEGHHADTIIPALEAYRKTIGVYFVVDSLSHLLRTGRVSNRTAFVGNLLKIKPILGFEAGKIVALSKERTKKKALNKVLADFKQATKNLDYPIRACVIDGNSPQESQEWVAQLQAQNPDLTIDTSHIGPVVGAHTGEKVMGIFWAADYQA